MVVVSLPSLVLPHNSASKGTAPSCAADRSCPSPVSRQLRHLRPLLLLLLLLLCRPSWCRETQALYFDKNCGLVAVVRGCSWLTSWSGLVVRRDLCGREGAGTRGRLATSLPTQVCCCEPAKLQRTQIKALKQPASKLKPENTHSRTTHSKPRKHRKFLEKLPPRQDLVSEHCSNCLAESSSPLLTPLADRWHIRPRAQIER